MPGLTPAEPTAIGLPRRAVRMWVAVWLALAFVAWHAVFDRQVIVAGRRFVAAAEARTAGPYLRIDDWMRPAVARGRRRANLAAGVVLAAGLAVRAGARWARAHPGSARAS